MKTLLIAEKPNMATEYARFLGVDNQFGGYYENDKWIISSARGHLIGSFMPDHKVALPYFPDEIPQKPIDSSKKMLDILCMLLNRKDVDCVVNACDPEREGQLIFSRIYQYSKSSLPIKRLWAVSNTKEALTDAFAHLKDGSAYQGLDDASVARAWADWVLGLNLSRAFFCPIGRVETPTSYFVYQAWKANKEFTPKPYWGVEANFLDSAGAVFSAKLQDADETGTAKFPTEAQAKTVQEKIHHSDSYSVQLEKKENKQAPPRLFDQTDAQRELMKKVGLSLESAEAMLQELYDKWALITYPRTAFNVLPADYAIKAQNIIEKLNKIGSPAQQAAIEASNQKLAILKENDKKIYNPDVGSHFAIIPTGCIKINDQEFSLNSVDLSAVLPELHYRSFMVIASRFLAVFFPHAVYEHLNVQVKNSQYLFKTSGKTLTSPGWLIVYGGDDTEEDKTPKLPNIQSGNVSLVGSQITTGTTKAPPLLTEDSLLALMKNAGRKLNDEDLSDFMSAGLGTPATRSPTIKRLKEPDKHGMPLVLVEKGKLIPSEKLIKIVQTLEKVLPEILYPDMTAHWESQLQLIERGETTYNKFISKLSDDVSLFVQKGREAMSANAPVLCECHLCKGTVQELNNFYRCSGCGFLVGKVICERSISDTDAKSIFENGKSPVLEFVSKKKKNFKAALVVGDDGDKKALKFEFLEKAEAVASNLNCPSCGRNMLKHETLYKCSPCEITIFTTISSRKLTEDELMNILEAGEDGYFIKGFTSKTGKLFDANLIFDADEKKLLFKFPQKKG